MTDIKMKPMMDSLKKTPYHGWVQGEGLPLVEAHGLEDVREVELKPWRRTGGKGAFIHLYGMEGITGMYVAEIPPGEALNAERHMYEEVICVLSGQGATEVWHEGGKKQSFEWSAWSLFSPPLNTRHRLVNGGREPVKFLAVTNAPLIMDTFHNLDFVFNSPITFPDRFRGEEDYFAMSQKRYVSGMRNLWETNFISDLQTAALEADKHKGTGLQLTQFELAGNSLIGHVAHWPAAQYQKAHYHAPGAILVGMQGEGYVLLWSKEQGIHPYEDGHGDQVVQLNWREASVYCPPGGWFHQHFNLSRFPARHLAIRYGGSRLHPSGMSIAAKRQEDGTVISIKKGGTLIEYEDEDPAIGRKFSEALKKAESGV